MKRCILTGVLAAAAALGTGSNPLGSLICSGTVQFNRVRMLAVGVYSWSVLPGDEILTEESPATLLFADKSRVFLDRDTRVRIQADGKAISVAVEQGSLRYSRMPGSPVRIRTGESQGPDKACGSVAVQRGKATWSAGCATSHPGDRATPPIPPSLGMHRPK